MKKKLLDIGTKVKYSETWLNHTGIPRKRFRGVVTAHYETKDPIPFVYVLWRGQELATLVNCDHLTSLGPVVKKPEPKTAANIPDLKTKDIAQIALIIHKDWALVNYAAAPYLDAMSELKTVNDQYGHDTGAGVVARFLANASSWRGDVARAVKAELRTRLKIGA